MKCTTCHDSLGSENTQTTHGKARASVPAPSAAVSLRPSTSAASTLRSGARTTSPPSPCAGSTTVGRRALDQVGFEFVVEAGLGRGHRDFRAIRLHTLPASRPASRIWRSAQADHQVEDRPAHKGMLASGELDRCGVTLLAGKAAGAPFVGAVAAALALGEVLRLQHGGTVHELIDLDLRAPEYRSVVPTPLDFSALNPGNVKV